MRKCVLLCPGYSLDSHKVTPYLKTEDVYCVNRAYRAFGPWEWPKIRAVFTVDSLPRFHESVDRMVLCDKQVRKIVNKGVRVKWRGVANVEYVPCCMDESEQYITTDPFDSPVYRGPPLSTLFAFWYLVRAKYERIGIEGCDGRFRDNAQPYFFDLRPKDPDHKRLRYAQVIEYMRPWCLFAQKRKVQVVNLSPESRLAEFLETKEL